MSLVLLSFGQFMGPAFTFLVAGMMWDFVINAFRGRF